MAQDATKSKHNEFDRSEDMKHQSKLKNQNWECQIASRTEKRETFWGAIKPRRRIGARPARRDELDAET
jgi:hypothetical protein